MIAPAWPLRTGREEFAAAALSNRSTLESCGEFTERLVGTAVCIFIRRQISFQGVFSPKVREVSGSGMSAGAFPRSQRRLNACTAVSQVVP
jgi:hypothetical protein